MVLPGSVSLKKATSSSVTVEKGSLSGIPLLVPGVLECSVLGEAPRCHRLPGRDPPQGSAGESLSAAAQEEVQRGLRHRSAAQRLPALWRFITMTGP